jgi:hypothetical protein
MEKPSLFRRPVESLIFMALHGDQLFHEEPWRPMEKPSLYKRPVESLIFMALHGDQALS